MTDRERIPWVRLWKGNLERSVGERWDRGLSLAIDAAVVLIEASA